MLRKQCKFQALDKGTKKQSFVGLKWLGRYGITVYLHSYSRFTVVTTVIPYGTVLNCVDPYSDLEDINEKATLVRRHVTVIRTSFVTRWRRGTLSTWRGARQTSRPPLSTSTTWWLILSLPSKILFFFLSQKTLTLSYIITCNADFLPQIMARKEASDRVAAQIREKQEILAEVCRYIYYIIMIGLTQMCGTCLKNFSFVQLEKRKDDILARRKKK